MVPSSLAETTRYVGPHHTLELGHSPINSDEIYSHAYDPIGVPSYPSNRAHNHLSSFSASVTVGIPSREVSTISTDYTIPSSNTDDSRTPSIHRSSAS